MTSGRWTILCVLLAAQPTLAAGAGLKIHLPRVRRVQAKALTVGEVCVVFGSQAKRTAAAEKVTLGRAPFSREEMRIDRDMILGRLVASGFDRHEIRFSGSKQVIVTLNEQEINASRLVAAASALLTRKHPVAAESRWQLSGVIEPVNISAGKPAKLSAIIESVTANRATVRVDIVREGRNERGRELTFVKEHLWRQAVARADIAAGQTISKQNVAIESLYRAQPQQNWQSPYGKHATRAIRAQTVLSPNLFASTRPAVVIERNSVVQIRVNLSGFTLLAKGLALSNGRVGQTVPVQNIDSKRILNAQVRADGTVEPILGESGK